MHLEVNTLSAIAAEIGQLVLVDTEGSSLSIKDASNVIRIYAAAISGSDPKFIISKATYNASTETDPDNLLFSSEYNYTKIIESGVITVSNFTSNSVDPNKVEVQYHEISYTNNDADREIIGSIYDATLSIFPLPLLQSYEGSDGIYQENILIGIVDVDGTRKIGIWRYMSNFAATAKTFDDISTYKVKWVVMAETLS